MAHRPPAGSTPVVTHPSSVGGHWSFSHPHFKRPCLHSLVHMASPGFRVPSGIQAEGPSLRRKDKTLHFGKSSAHLDGGVGGRAWS
jgi:hypothetical protein